MTNYQLQYVATIVVVSLIALTGAIQLAGAADLGLSPVMFRWIGITASVLGVIQTFLPSIRRAPVKKDDAGPVGAPDPMPRDK